MRCGSSLTSAEFGGAVAVAVAVVDVEGGRTSSSVMRWSISCRRCCAHGAGRLRVWSGVVVAVVAG